MLRTLIVGALLSLPPALAVDINDLLRRSVAATERDFKEADSFTYVERDVSQKLDARGTPRSRMVKEFEVSIIDGTRTVVCWP